jgi:GPI mannosyltransferase 2
MKVLVWRIPYTILLVVITLIPFIYHQYSAYRVFCYNSSIPSPWCTKFPPFIYTYVQSKYWNVGFLQYWTLSQLPNFVLAAPVLLLLLSSSIHHIRQTVTRYLSGQKQSQYSPFSSPSLIPHAIHAFILTTTLLFASHTQIILRLAGSMPFTYWSAAWLLFERPAWGKWWVGWSVIWGSVSLVLWAVFLPPA